VFVSGLPPSTRRRATSFTSRSPGRRSSCSTR
jgi:hypothetical protein